MGQKELELLALGAADRRTVHSGEPFIPRVVASAIKVAPNYRPKSLFPLFFGAVVG